MTTDPKMMELRHRVEAKRLELQSWFEALRADATARHTDTVEGIRARLQELEETLRDGWAHVKESTLERLNAWLRKD